MEFHINVFYTIYCSLGFSSSLCSCTWWYNEPWLPLPSFVVFTLSHQNIMHCSPSVGFQRVSLGLFICLSSPQWTCQSAVMEASVLTLRWTNMSDLSVILTGELVFEMCPTAALEKKTNLLFVHGDEDSSKYRVVRENRPGSNWTKMKNQVLSRFVCGVNFLLPWRWYLWQVSTIRYNHAPFQFWPILVKSCVTFILVKFFNRQKWTIWKWM